MACAHLRRLRTPLSRFATFLMICVAGSAAAQAPAPISAELQRLLDTEAWQLEYQISFKASASGSDTMPAGAYTYQKTLGWDATETVPLDIRSQGATIAMQKLTATLSNPAAAANMQKAMLDIAMQSDSIASWMVGAGVPALEDDASAEQIQAAIEAAAKKSVGTITLDYSQQTRGDELRDEFGKPYKQIVRTTRRGTGGVTPVGQQITFELNAATKRVALMLPVTLPALFDATFTEEIVTTTEYPPGATPTSETKTSTSALDTFPSRVEVTDAAVAYGNGAVMLVDNPMTLQGGKLSGQVTTPASYDDFGTAVNGTLVVRYTLTPL